jgi:D-alanyl-lipoteichoic acid acyltransferase DltB (MBOAT superfamily)
MLFNSIDFWIFFPIVLVLYWTVTQRSLRWQNILLLVSSYYFYGSWDVRFLGLLAFSTALDYVSGLLIQAGPSPARKRLWLILSVGINLSLLGLFKYYNFFAESFASFTASLGLDLHPTLIAVVLPVGISFYTFHGLSYVFDIYHGRIRPVRNVVEYALFVSFFPLLVAGPIERATHLLPQLQRPRRFEASRAADGLRQVLWGMFKKVVIADNCAEQVDLIFGAHADLSGSTLLLGAVLFAFQIYGDFSGYSDIALGTARLMGIELLQNFSFPYFSRDIAEFWRRWHISLSSWFRDYLYVPLGGSRGGTAMRVRNTFIIFLVSGFWHGANWTFVIWGALNALYFLPLLLTQSNRQHLGIVAEGRLLPSFKELIQVLSTFLLTCLAWVFFRAKDVGEAIGYLSGLFDRSLFTLPSMDNSNLPYLLLFFMAVEWKGREGRYGLERIGLAWLRPVRWSFYALLLAMMALFMRTEEAPFIYFQF